MKNNFKCFLIEENGVTRRKLRRYAGDKTCSNRYGYHNAETPIESVQGESVSGDIHPHDDPRWPKTCSCGYEFTDDDNWQLSSDREYVRKDTGETMTLRDAPTGAIWRAPWYEDLKSFTGTDGKSYICRMPGGRDWMIDGRASNCTKPNDNEHKCWCRHGEAPNFTVNKNGNTCSAGAGSIQMGDGWHGFLVNGELQEC